MDHKNHTTPSTLAQEEAFDRQFASSSADYGYHFTTDPLTRFARDRRLEMAWRTMIEPALDPRRATALVVCGGIGGEAAWLKKKGFQTVVNSELSASALAEGATLVPDVIHTKANAESLPFDDGEFDVVIVQDGLHHLPKPTLGLNEMLRVSKNLTIVLEPHDGLVGRLIGTEWEKTGETENYVFRWNVSLLEQIARSQCGRDVKIQVIRHFNHNLWTVKLANLLKPSALQLPTLRAFYSTADRMAFAFGNSFIGCVKKTVV